jgi:hypothetical protein
MQAALSWDRPLRFRRGAKQRLRAIEVYYDFRWSDHFPDRRVQFRGGQDLADVVARDCPAGKRPALLLVDRDEVDEGARETDTHYIMVINLPNYVASADDPRTATAYLAGLLGGGITRAKRFSALTEDEADEAARWLDAHLDVVALERWAGRNEARLQILRRIGGSTTVDDGEAEIGTPVERAIAALESLETIGPEIAEAIAELASSAESLEERIALLWQLTEDPAGRLAAGETLRARVTDRLDDARHAADEFDALLDRAGETEVQRFLESNPWLLGLDYAAVRMRQPVVRGVVDFLLERFDGFHDLLELKGPGDPLFELSDDNADIRSPSRFRLSRPLSLALAQVHAYRDILREESTHERFYGLRNTRDAKITILIGRVEGLTDQEQRVLHELNCSLHNVEIVPFDILGRRARAVLANARRYLVTADDETGRSD